MLVAAGLLLCGCSSQSEKADSDTGIHYYYIKNNSLVEEPVKPVDESEEEIFAAQGDPLIEDLINRVNSGTDIPSDGMSFLQNDVSILSYYRDANILRINLTGDFGSITPTYKMFLVAGIVNTFCQVEGVDAVAFSIHGEPLLNENGTEYGVFTVEDFILQSNDDINNYESREMTLYFADREGKELVPVTRTVYYNRNKQLELVVLEELVKGPLTVTEFSVLPQVLKIASVTVIDGVCYVNFEADATANFAGTNMKLAVQSITESLYSVCGIEAVQFQINGDSDIDFGEGISFDRTYSPEK